MYDHITLAFGKRDLINSSISSATILNSLAESFPKSFPPQCKHIKSGTGPTFSNVLMFWHVWLNWSPLYSCHHSEMSCLSNVKFVLPSLITAFKNACLISEEPTNHIVCDSKMKLIKTLVCKCKIYMKKTSSALISGFHQLKTLLQQGQCMPLYEKSEICILSY